MEKGFYTALGTPLDENGNFLADSMTNQIRQQIECGASGLLVLGSMGNQAYLKNSEFAKVIACSVEAARGEAPVLVGVTDTSIGRVMDRVAAISDIKGVDGIVSTVPYYAVLSQDQIYTFYNEIANRSGRDTYLYDLAVVTKTATAAATVKKLWKNPLIKGIKSGNLVTQRQLMRAEDRPADFTQMFSNLDEFDVAYAYGIDKNLDGMFACTPKTAQKMYTALAAGDTKTGADCLDQIIGLRDLFLSTSCLMSAFTHAMNHLGCRGRFGRDYEPDISDENKERVIAYMKEMGEL